MAYPLCCDLNCVGGCKRARVTRLLTGMLPVSKDQVKFFFSFLKDTCPKPIPWDAMCEYSAYLLLQHPQGFLHPFHGLLYSLESYGQILRALLCTVRVDLDLRQVKS